MHDSETRALRRTALILLAVSALRLMWPSGSAAPVAGVATDSLLDQSQQALIDADNRSRPLAPGERIDPNRAAAAELDRLPGVGAVAAEAIVEERERGGPFQDAGDLVRVRGIGTATIAKIRPHLDLSASTSGRAALVRPRPTSGPPVIDINRATAVELLALPGIGPALAARIVDARKEAVFGSVEDLLQVRGIGAATLARLRALVTAGGVRRRR